MAVTADQVEVRLRADTGQYVRNLTQADAAFNKTAAGIQANSAKVSAATNSLSFNTGNIAAQFQDIGVTAAAGMNPLIIALQQGTQLSAVLNQSVSQGVSPVKALGGAFLQVLNPISLATIATIALGTALLQSLGSIVPKAESATEAIKRHREALEGVVRGYAGAEDAVAAYFDQVQRLPQFAVTEGLQKQFAELETAATALPGKLQDVTDYVTALGTSATDTDREILSLIEQFQAGDISLEELYGSLGTAAQGMGFLEAAAGNLGLGAKKTVEDLRGLIVTVTQFGDAYARFMALTQINLGAAPVNEDLQNALDLRAYVAEQERLNSLTSEQLSLEKEIARIKADAGELGITDERARELAEATLSAEERRAQIKRELTAGSKQANDAERERQAVLDMIGELEHEYEILGLTNQERAVANALRDAGAVATEQQRERIAELVNATYEETEAIKGLNKSSQEWANTLQSATRGFIDDLIEGKSAAEAFSNVLSSIAKKLIDVGLNSVFSGFPGFGTPTRATGGPIYSGGPTLVGEKGPELFVPSGPGKIVPNSQIGGGGSVVFAPNIDARGADVAAVARLETAVQRLAAEVVPTIRKEIASGPSKGRR